MKALSVSAPCAGRGLVRAGSLQVVCVCVCLRMCTCVRV